MPEATDLAAAIRALAARDRDAAGDHPQVDELTAYAEGALSAERSEALLAHAALCRECSALLLEYSEFTPQRANVPNERAEVETAYRRIGERLASRDEPPVALPSRSRPAVRWNPWVLAAAGLAVLALGLWGWLGHRTVAELRQPRLEVVSIDLSPSGSDLARGAGSQGTLRLDTGATLYLALPGNQDPGELALTLVDTEGRTLWSGGGARRDPVLGNVTLHLPPRSLAPGRYEIRIATTDDGALLASYPLEVY